VTLGDLPVVSALADAGPDDRVFDALLLAGPSVVLLVAVAGRSLVTEAVAGVYLAALIGHVCYLWLRGRD